MERKRQSKPESDHGRRFEAPAPCQFRVQGHLDDSGSRRLGGMVLTRAFTGNKQPMTILIGKLNDKAALSGVLNALYNQHLTVRSIELLDVQSRESSLFYQKPLIQSLLRKALFMGNCLRHFKLSVGLLKKMNIIHYFRPDTRTIVTARNPDIVVCYTSEINCCNSNRAFHWGSINDA